MQTSMIRPSSLPALKECACFESGSSEFAEAGTDRHAALSAALNGDLRPMALLPDEDADGVRWALEYIKMISSSEFGFHLEKTIEADIQDFVTLRGTPDVGCGFDVFDLKWRDRDYSSQMAAYAWLWSVAQKLPEGRKVRVHVLYACFKRIECLEFYPFEARRVIDPIIENALDPDRQPSPCSYCNWCSKKVVCPALNERAQAIGAGREDWKLEQYHTSEITDPNEMAKALALATHVTKWAEAVRHFAKEMATKQGVTIPGYKLRYSKGKASCSDVAGAFNASGLPVETFLACCDLRQSTSKTNPNKIGIINAYAEANGLPQAAAKRTLKTKLDPFMRTPSEIVALVPDKQTNDEEGENSDA